MKTLQKITLLFALVILFASCQSNTDVEQILSKSETRKEIMDSIANNSDMSNEMMGAMMNNKNSMMMMQGNEKMRMMMMENHSAMMKMMKDNPAKMQSMMTDMMETAKGDTAMMSGMCKAMMTNQEMTDMMKKMMGEKKEMKMDGMKH